MNTLRHESRIAIERTGVLTRYGQKSECRLSDFTEHGFRLQTDVLSPVVNEVLDLSFAWTPSKASSVVWLLRTLTRLTWVCRS